MNFKEWILNEATSGEIIVYHGTSPRNFRSIMSQGLIPEPKKRAWATDNNTSFSGSSRQSLSGVYVSSNLLTATGAASNGSNGLKDGKLIVIAEIQPKTSYLDEDDLNRFSYISDSEEVIAGLYGALNSNHPNDEFVKQQYDKFKDNFYKKYQNLHPNLMRRLETLLWDYFIKAVTRKAAYLDDWKFRKTKDYVDNLQKPDKAKAEADMLRAKEALTKTLKNYSRLEDNYLQAMRVMQPIKFNGPNRILGIVYEPDTRKDGAAPEVWYGRVPYKFIHDWETYIGEWKPKEINVGV